MKSAGKIRVVAGSAGGLWLTVPKKFPSRPTQDRIKQAVFSSLGARVPEARVLDLYAGTGSLGIEALSRGAATAVFVDSDKRCTDTIRNNLAHCRLEGAVITADALSWSAQAGGPFDIILLDPPYEKMPLLLDDHPLLPLLAGLLEENGIVVWEHHSNNVWNSPDGWTLHKSVQYGETAVSQLTKIS